jgi:thymidylate kinase
MWRVGRNWLSDGGLPVCARPRTRPLLITFSGIDGSGKSTSIATLTAMLTNEGLRVRVATFWDNVVVFPRLRENLSRKLFRGETGVGKPERPVQRRDKNLRPWYATLGRCGFYMLDSIHLRWLVKKMLSNEELDVVIFDRYFYDQLAILPIEVKAVRIYARLLFKLLPRPDLAYLMDADPEAAFTRKPEYPLEFLKQYRRSYLLVRKLMGGITLIHALPLEETSREVADEFKRARIFAPSRTSAISDAHEYSGIG